MTWLHRIKMQVVWYHNNIVRNFFGIPDLPAGVLKYSSIINAMSSSSNSNSSSSNSSSSSFSVLPGDEGAVYVSPDDNSDDDQSDDGNAGSSFGNRIFGIRRWVSQYLVKCCLV